MRLGMITLIWTTVMILVCYGCGKQAVANGDLVIKPAWASAVGHDRYGTWADLVIAGIVQRFRLIPAGTFTIGCDDAETEAAYLTVKNMGNPTIDRTMFVSSQHSVTFTHSFWLGDSACTQAMWLAVTGGNPSWNAGDLQCPVEKVSWSDCQKFCAQANQLVRAVNLRLPTEAEWEYACRSGSTGPFNGEPFDSMAWNQGNSDDRTHAVRQKTPNAWGLYDMHGNIRQWCEDYFGAYPKGVAQDPTGPKSGLNRVERGGSAFDPPVFCRSAFRGWFDPEARVITVGFRLCFTAAPGSDP